jgi:hypothetical protein
MKSLYTSGITVVSGYDDGLLFEGLGNYFSATAENGCFEAETPLLAILLFWNGYNDAVSSYGIICTLLQNLEACLFKQNIPLLLRPFG